MFCFRNGDTGFECGRCLANICRESGHGRGTDIASLSSGGCYTHEYSLPTHTYGHAYFYCYCHGYCLPDSGFLQIPSALTDPYPRAARETAHMDTIPHAVENPNENAVQDSEQNTDQDSHHRTDQYANRYPAYIHKYACYTDYTSAHFSIANDAAYSDPTAYGHYSADSDHCAN